MAKFNAHSVLCCVELINKEHRVSLTMIIDTGSSYTIISSKAAKRVGTCKDGKSVNILTGSRIEEAKVIKVPTLKALGFSIHNFPVVIYDLPSRRRVDGILGINFLKKSKAVIDFSNNKICAKN